MRSKYKLDSICTLILFILLSSFVSCFASVDFEFDGVDYSFADFPFDTSDPNLHYVLLHNYYGYCVYYSLSSDFERFVFDDSRSQGVLSAFDSTGVRVGDIYISDYNTDSDTWGDCREWGDVTGTNFTFLKSNCPVYDTEGKVFFSVTPLAQVVSKVELTQGITTTIVGLVKLLIPLLIFLVGFWKAWAFLSKTLRQA